MNSALRNISGSAICLSGGLLDRDFAKTTHGLVRDSRRFSIEAVIDRRFGGKDAGELLDGIHRDIPVYNSVQDFIESAGVAEYCIVGVATEGGFLPETMRSEIKSALISGMSVINGLHEFLNDDPDLKQAAGDSKVTIYDIRKPRPKKELSFWTGEIFDIKQAKIGVLGTDCAVGKRTTANMIARELIKRNYKAEMIFTGQTGWMQGWNYGYILDTTTNDFVSGELENAMLKCAREVAPDIMILEGQSGLRNFSGPCGSELLLSGNLDGVVLQHAPERIYFIDFESKGLVIPTLKSEVDLISMYGKKVLAIALNTVGLTLAEAKKWQKRYEDELQLPVALPLEEGIDSILPVIEDLIKSKIHEFGDQIDKS
jgi:uncharacterized NAD-dependent epimerase/dehydratase family protein